MDNVTKDELHLGEDGVLYKTYVDFVGNLMETVCPMGVPCPELPQGDATGAPDGHLRHSRELLSRRLCYKFDELRRMLCGTDMNVRRLDAGGIFQDAEIYEITNECPDEYEVEEGDDGKSI
jgi:hypothetical protein